MWYVLGAIGTIGAFAFLQALAETLEAERQAERQFQVRVAEDTHKRERLAQQAQDENEEKYAGARAYWEEQLLLSADPGHLHDVRPPGVPDGETILCRLLAVGPVGVQLAPIGEDGEEGSPFDLSYEHLHVEPPASQEDENEED